MNAVRINKEFLRILAKIKTKVNKIKATYYYCLLTKQCFVYIKKKNN